MTDGRYFGVGHVADRLFSCATRARAVRRLPTYSPDFCTRCAARDQGPVDLGEGCADSPRCRLIAKDSKSLDEDKKFFREGAGTCARASTCNAHVHLMRVFILECMPPPHTVFVLFRLCRRLLRRRRRLLMIDLDRGPSRFHLLPSLPLISRSSRPHRHPAAI